VRIVLVSQDFPPTTGGVQTWSLAMARELARAHEVVVVAPRSAGDAAIDATLPCPVVRTPGGSDGLWWAGAPTLLRTIRRVRPEVVVHAQWTSAPLSAALRHSGAVPRLVVVTHGRELLLRPPPPLDRVYTRARRTVLHACDRVVAVSRYTARLCAGLGVAEDRIDVVANGTDPDRFAAADLDARARDWRRSLGLGDRPIALALARLRPHKGIDTAIAALARTRARVSDAALVVIGDGPDRARLTELARTHGVADAVHLLGRRSDDEVTIALRAADVLVLLSREHGADVEGFGIVLLEAGAAGRPVIAARSGGIADAVEHGESGLLVPPDDVEVTTDAWTRLLGDGSEAARMGAVGRARVVDGFTWRHTAARLATLLEPDARRFVTSV